MSKVAVALAFALLLATPAYAQKVSDMSCSSPREYNVAMYSLQKNHGTIIGPPLSHEAHECFPNGQCFDIDEYQAVRDAVAKRQADDAVRGYCNPCAMTCLQDAAYDHVMNGQPIRLGDFIILHGMLKFGMSVETVLTGKKFERLYDASPKCRGEAAKDNPECVGY